MAARIQTTVVTRSLLTGLGRMSRAGRPPAAVWIPSALVAAAMALPLAYVVLRAIGAGSEAWDLLFRVRVLETLGRTVSLMAAVTAASIVLAVPLAWLTVRTDLPFRRFWAVVTALPLVVPSYVGGFVVVAALGPKGLLQEYVAGPLGIERLPDIHGFVGAMLTLALLSYPYVLVSVRAALWGLDPSLEETSRSLGQSTARTFFRVVLPQLRPAILAGALLVALYTLSDFGAVSLLRYEVFTYVIYLQYDAGARALAASSSLVLVALALAVLAIASRLHGGARYHRTAGGSAHPGETLRLGMWRWPALAFCAAVSILALGTPLAVLGFWLARGAEAGESLGLSWGAVFNSVRVSGVAALVATAAALPVALLAARYSSWFSALIERMAYLGFALPGVVVALALVYFGANYVEPVYQTFSLLVFAYVLLFLPAALGVLRASILQISPRVEEAARGLGKRPYEVFAMVTLPMVRPGMLAGIALVFLIAMKELPATLILGPIGFNTLATSVWSAAEAAFFAQAAAPALVLILVSSVALFVLMLRERNMLR